MKKNYTKEAILLSTLLLAGCSSKYNNINYNASDFEYERNNTNIFLEENTNQEVEEETSTTVESQVEENLEEYTQIIEVEENHEIEHVDLVMIGDVLVHEPVYKSGIQSDGSLNYDHLFENIEYDLAEAEIKIVNQETILGGMELGFSSYPCFNSPQEIGIAEANAEFNVICQATNHAMDKGYKAINNTIEFWENNYPNIAVLGLNKTAEDQDNIYIYKQGDFKIAILNYTYGTNGIPLPSDKPYLVNILDKEKVTKDILKAKSMADFVVVTPHWGTEYQYTPDTLQQEYTQLFSDLGVDLVIGTHPHVLENMEVITNEEGHEMLVYYSLGNFMSGQTERPRVIGGMAKVSIEKDYETDKCFITEYELDPIITQQGEYTAYKLEDYNDDLASKNAIRNKSGCSDFNMEYINDFCEEVLGEDFDRTQEKVRVRVK